MSAEDRRWLRLELSDPAGTRADQALARALGRPVSRQALREAFATGEVRLAPEGAGNAGPGRALEAGDKLLPKVARARELALVLGAAAWEALVRERGPALPSPRGAFLPIVYEDERLLVLHKLSGVPSVPHSPGESAVSAVGAALARAPALPSRPDHELEPGLLHRLDTGTSGLLVFAKSETERSRLRELWRAGDVRKFYRACAAPAGASADRGPAAPGPGADPAPAPPRAGLRIDAPLGHDAKSRRRMIALSGARAGHAIRGKALAARTEILATRSAPALAGALDLTIAIETGVMHQIRCHLSSIGWPILGDAVYGGASAPRLWLHAWRIEIPLAHGSRLCLEAQLPDGWPAC